ncbi:MAG: hypothetical protein H6672_21180 [Anaerolineaceae bacterium]|nr:hypothetical protein [Anaerolineaceae bacterium]
MNDISPQVIQLCGLAVGVGILILLAGLLVLRVMKGSVFGLGMLVMRMFTDAKEEDEPATAHSQAQSSVHDHSLEELRAKAESLDFDSAVQKYRSGEAQHVGTEKDDN